LTNSAHSGSPSEHRGRAFGRRVRGPPRDKTRT